MNWLQKISGKISDMIPNEFSKLNSFSRFLPPPLNLAVQMPAAADRFGETYSNKENGGFGSLADAFMYGGGAFTGEAGDPNKYSDKNVGFGKDWTLNVGKIGGLMPTYSGGGQWDFPIPSYQNLLGEMMMKKQNQDTNFGSRSNGIRNVNYPQIQMMPYGAMGRKL